MSWIHYIDNEVPWDAPAHYGEWDSLVEAGGSTIVRAAAASFPDRGSYGLRCQTVSGDVAYVQKDDTTSVAAGGELYVGFWMYVAALPAGNTYIGSLFDGATAKAMIVLATDGQLRVYCRRDAGSGFLLSYTAPPAATGRWLYFVFAVKRASSGVASDGWFRMYFDGCLVKQVTGQDNFDTWNCQLDLRAGCQTGAQNDLDVYLDEHKVAASYPEPHVPTPADEYPSADRTAVLYRMASADSVAFADYCATELGIPLANLIALPEASAGEYLADYATFQSEVEDGIDDYLALNPTVAANCSCFLIGHGVPGYFTSAAVVHSAASRLMNYGTAFSSGTANALYAPSTVERLTKTALGGKHLCCRIDADTLQHSKDLIDRAATVSALAELTDADTLWSGDATYRASLACQKLRILTDRIVGGEGIEADDAAFIWFTAGGGFGTGGSKIAIVGATGASAYSLRSSGTECFAALHGGNTFAAALGNSHTADTFDAESFFEMLRIGGTLAEAVIVAVAKLDYTAVGAGSPLLTVAFQLGGYNVYRGVGSADVIDYQTLLGAVRPGVAALELAGLGHTPGLEYFYGLRAVSSAGVEEANTTRVVRALVNAQGQLVGAPPNEISHAAAAAIAAGKLQVSFFYQASGQAAAASAVQVAQIVAGGPDWESLLATIAVAGTTRRSAALEQTFGDGETVRLAMRAVTAGGVAGPVKLLDPVVADATGPPAVAWAAAEQVGL